MARDTLDRVACAEGVHHAIVDLVGVLSALDGASVSKDAQHLEATLDHVRDGLERAAQRIKRALAEPKPAKRASVVATPAARKRAEQQQRERARRTLLRSYSEALRLAQRLRSRIDEDTDLSAELERDWKWAVGPMTLERSTLHVGLECEAAGRALARRVSHLVDDPIEVAPDDETETDTLERVQLEVGAKSYQVVKKPGKTSRDATVANAARNIRRHKTKLFEALKAERASVATDASSPVDAHGNDSLERALLRLRAQSKARLDELDAKIAMLKA